MIGGDELVSLGWFVGAKDRNAMGESHKHLLTFTVWMEIRKGSQEGPPGAESPWPRRPRSIGRLLSRVLMSPGGVRDPRRVGARGRGLILTGEGWSLRERVQTPWKGVKSQGKD